MPRPSEKCQALEALDDAIESAIFVYLVESSSSEDELEDIEELIIIRESLASQRCLPTDTSAGLHGEDSLEAYIHHFDDSTFRSLFRMHRASFWQLVELLTKAGGTNYWGQIAEGPVAGGPVGRPPRPIYQQIAVGLCILGGGMTMSKSRVTMNIAQGTTWKYAWRTITLLARLLGDYVRWPIRGTRHGNHDIFRHCIGFLDGSNIVLRDRPMLDPEAYLSRNQNYGFNLQAICDWNGKFIWMYMGHTASAHDSTAFKSTDIYRNSSTYFDPEEYILADKAYALERHVITSYEEPTSRETENTAENAAFNKQFSTARVKIAHAFGVLKARWPTLRNIPVCIPALSSRPFQY